MRTTVHPLYYPALSPPLPLPPSPPTLQSIHVLIYLYTSRNSDSVYLGLDSDWLLVENITLGYIPAAVLPTFLH
jgi:hypothetical protein